MCKFHLSKEAFRLNIYKSFRKYILAIPEQAVKPRKDWDYYFHIPQVVQKDF